MNTENVPDANHFKPEQRNILLSSSAEGGKQMKKTHKDKKQTVEYDLKRFVFKLYQLKLRLCSTTSIIL